MTWRNFRVLLCLLVFWEVSALSEESAVERSGWSQSYYTLVDIKYRWTVKTISFLHHSVSSDAFSAPGTTMDAVKWKLWVTKPQFSGSNCVWFSAFDIGVLDQVVASYNFNVTDINGKVVFSGKQISSTIFKKGDEVKFCSGDLYNLITKGLLPDDTIILEAFIRMADKIWSVSSENPSRYFDVPACDFNEQAKSLIGKDLQYSNTFFILDSGETVPVPRTLLASKSAEFDRIFNTSFKPIPEPTKVSLPGIDVQTMRIIASLAYTEANLTSQISSGSGLEKKLLEAANKYGLESLKMGVQKVLSNRVTKDNALDMLDLAKKYDANQLKDFIVDFIRKHALNMPGEEWKSFLDKMVIKQCKMNSKTCH